MGDKNNRTRPVEAEADGLIEGRNAVIEALRSGTAIDKIYIARGETDATSHPPPGTRALWWRRRTGGSWTA